MRIVIISDTHGLHDSLTLPAGDVLIHAGDWSMAGKPHEIISFNSWFMKQNFRHRICIAGNHELLLERQSSYARSLITGGNIYLQDKAVVIDGIKFYGSPHQPEFFNWAFNLPRGQALKEKWAMIPSDTDVLITHGPPYGILDSSGYSVPILSTKKRDPYHSYPIRGGDWSDPHVGCQDLLERVKQVKPKVHCFGHIHHSYGVDPPLFQSVSDDFTIFVNACICDEAYQPTRQPIVIDI